MEGKRERKGVLGVEMSRWWLFLGFMFVCSGFLMPLGAIIIAWYFIDFITKNEGTKSKTTDLGIKMDDFSKETMEEMR